MTEAVKKEVVEASRLFKSLSDSGQANFYIKDDFEEMAKRDYDPNKDLKPYLVGTFGSAWGVLKVDCQQYERSITIAAYCYKAIILLAVRM